MTEYGVTPSGFVKKTYSVIHDEIVEEYRNRLGRSIDLSDESPDGQIIGINTVQIAALWDALEASYYAKYPHTATGVSLDNAALLTNTKRERATKSITTLTFTGAANTVIPIGTLVETEEGIRVATTAGGIIGPSETTVTVPASAETTGPIVALAGTLKRLTNPISGVTAVTNPTDLTDGRAEETDAEFKQRRIAELQRPGKPTSDGIRNQLLTLDYVTKAMVLSNKTDGVDSDGRPPHSIECFLTTTLLGSLADNADKRAEIANLIFKSKADGIQTWGTISETVTDSQGSTEVIKFSEPIPVDIVVICVIEINEDPADGPLFPDEGLDLIKKGILAYGAGLSNGQSVWHLSVASVILTVPGVKKIYNLSLNDTYGADIPIGKTQISRWSSSNITIIVGPL